MMFLFFRCYRIYGDEVLTENSTSSDFPIDFDSHCFKPEKRRQKKMKSEVLQKVTDEISKANLDACEVEVLCDILRAWRRR